MQPFWLRMTQNAVEIGVVIMLLGFSALIYWDSVRLGPGWGAHGPDPGFFPFVMTSLIVIGALGVLLMIYKQPRTAPFFEVNQEVVDLLKVGLPIVATIFIMQWLGLYIASGLYIGFFMLYYGEFRWHSALLGTVVFPVILWLVLVRAFNIAMPMSMFYRDGILPV